MNPVRLVAVLGCMAVLFPRAGATESNAWPLHVAQCDAAGQVTSWESIGPLFFRQPAAEGGIVSGFRPLFVRTTDASGLTRVATVLYPVYIYRADSDTYQWTILNLINGSGPKAGVAGPSSDQTKAFDLWPFWFSRQTGSPETSYRALFPLGGTIKNRFGHDQLSWVLWPLFFQTEKHGAVTTSTPWPFIQATRGTAHGFALWPLYGSVDRPDRYHRSFFLWPLGWDNTIQPPEESPPGTPPTHQAGFIPFYTRETQPGYLNEDFLWPFFGHTDRTEPTRYHETRYFWPLFVQGRGDSRLVNRWGPFYTHSIQKGTDKTWIMWPLIRQTSWSEEGVAQKKTQFLYLLYWSLEQRSLANPRAAPADRTDVWPLFTKWDNGAGRRQFQLFSPFDVFFPTNENVQQSWTPLFALYRFDQRAPDDRRWSLLWHAVTWRHERDEREFHLGPLFSVLAGPGRERVALGHGLLGWQREPGDRGWHVFWFDFAPKVSQLPPSSR